MISVIIVNWNGKGLLRDCLGSIRAQTFKDLEVILVDNGSRDGSLEYVRKDFPEVRTIGLPENRGFAAGNNAGIRIATGRYIALLNNDATADPRWLERLADAAETASGRDIGMWASKVLTHDQPHLIDNVGLLIYRDGTARGKGRLETDRGQYDQDDEAFVPSGCAAFYRRAMLDEIGLFDEEFFAYADDVDLGLRGRLAGWGCRFVPAAVVYHRYSASSSAYSSLKAYLVERNRIRVLLRYFPPVMIAASLYYTPKRLVYQFAASLLGKGASARFRTEQGLAQAAMLLLKAWCAALADAPRVLKQRWDQRALRRLGRCDLYSLLARFELSAAELAEKD